jgi:hypothetical protein
MAYFSSVIPAVYTGRIIDGIFRIKKRTVRWRGSFCMWFYRRNHRGIQIGISVQSHDRFTVRMADKITDRSSSSVIPSAKLNNWPLCRPSPPIFLLLLPHPNSPLLQTTSTKKKNLTLLSKSHISLSFVVITSVFWFADGFYKFL